MNINLGPGLKEDLDNNLNTLRSAGVAEKIFDSPTLLPVEPSEGLPVFEVWWPVVDLQGNDMFLWVDTFGGLVWVDHLPESGSFK